MLTQRETGAPFPVTRLPVAMPEGMRGLPVGETTAGSLGYRKTKT
jgi:hypothetical protein